MVQIKVTYPPALHPKKRDDWATFVIKDIMSQILGIFPRNINDAYIKRNIYNVFLYQPMK